MAGTPPNPAAGKHAHPIQIPRVRPLYRFAATGLSASMWFFVGVYADALVINSDSHLAYVQSEARRTSAIGVEGTLQRGHCSWIL